MEDDILATEKSISSLAQQEKEIILLLHSAGGFLGSEAMKDLSVTERIQSGLKGGVKGIVFLTAALWPVGYQHIDLPFMDTVVRSLIPSQTSIY